MNVRDEDVAEIVLTTLHHQSRLVVDYALKRVHRIKVLVPNASPEQIITAIEVGMAEAFDTK